MQAGSSQVIAAKKYDLPLAGTPMIDKKKECVRRKSRGIDR
jgi:hypothetical protein